MLHPEVEEMELKSRTPMLLSRVLRLFCHPIVFYDVYPPRCYINVPPVLIFVEWFVNALPEATRTQIFADMIVIVEHEDGDDIYGN